MSVNTLPNLCILKDLFGCFNTESLAGLQAALKDNYGDEFSIDVCGSTHGDPPEWFSPSDDNPEPPETFSLTKFKVNIRSEEAEIFWVKEFETPTSAKEFQEELNKTEKELERLKSRSFLGPHRYLVDKIEALLLCMRDDKNKLKQVQEFIKFYSELMEEIDDAIAFSNESLVNP